MRQAVLATAGWIVLLSAAFACGKADNGEIEEGVRLVLQADMRNLPPGTDPDEAMDDLREVLERRLKAFDAHYEIDAAEANRLTVTVEDVTTDAARDLLARTARLEFRSPVRDDDGSIVCENPDGSTYDVPFAPAAFVQDATNNLRCMANPEGTSGVVQWEPAMATDSEGAERVLTGDYLRPSARVVGPPVSVAIEFTSEGGLLFEQITGELVGLPLAIFLDEDLIGAPTVQQAITGGQTTITGLTAEEVKTLAILLNAGALPVPVEVIREEAVP